MDKVRLGLVVSLLFTGASTIYAICTSRKMDKLLDKIDITSDDLANRANIDIDPVIIREATDKAVTRAVNKKVDTEMEWIERDVDQRVKKDVKAALDEAYPTLTADLRERLNKQLEDIDISSVKDEVVRKAAEKASAKFDKDLESVLSSYNDQIKSIGSVYRSIVKTMNPDNNLYFRI